MFFSGVPVQKSTYLPSETSDGVPGEFRMLCGVIFCILQQARSAWCSRCCWIRKSEPLKELTRSWSLCMSLSTVRRVLFSFCILVRGFRIIVVLRLFAAKLVCGFRGESPIVLGFRQRAHGFFGAIPPAVVVVVLVARPSTPLRNPSLE